MKASWSYPPDRVLRGALLGCGTVSAHHMEAWHSMDDVRIVAVANRTREKALALAGRYGLSAEHVYGDYRELLRAERIDFVDVATTPEIHLEQILAAAGHGCHILCQKPFASSLDEAERMIAGCRSAGVLLSVHENWRMRSWYVQIKALIDGGEIGRPLYGFFRRHSGACLPGVDGGAPALAVKEPFTTKREHLIIYEWGIHLFDVARFLFGEPLSVYACTSRVSPLFRGEDRAVVVLHFPSSDVVLDMSWATVTDSGTESLLEEVTIEADAGSIELQPRAGDVMRVVRRGSAIERPAMQASAALEYQQSYLNVQRDFIEALRAGRFPQTHAADNLRTLAAVFAAYESARCNQTIDLGEYHGGS